MPNFSLERKESGVIAGVDEAGRGPWAGPVVAAAVIVWQDGSALKGIPRGLDDCKKLAPERREELYQKLSGKFATGIGIADVATIDAVNILEASKIAMQRAVAALSVVPGVVLVDGPHAPAFPCRAVPVVGGDGKSISIAAASIIAKVTRDRIMRELHRDYPHYGWESNMGYGTRTHQNGLKAHGVCAHHRKSFAPIRALLEGVHA